MRGREGGREEGRKGGRAYLAGLVEFVLEVEKSARPGQEARLLFAGGKGGA